MRTTCCGGPSGISAAIRAGRRAARDCASPSRRSSASAASSLEREGTTAYLKFALSRAGGDRCRLLPDAGARRRADRREGREPLVEFPRRAAAAQGAALHGAGRARARLGGRRRAAADGASRSSTRCRSRRSKACRCRRSKRRGSRRSSACGTAGVTDGEVARAKRQLRARLVFENDSVTNIAHQLGYFETVTGPGFSRRAAAAHRRRDRRAGLRRRAAPPAAGSADGRLVPAAGVALMTPTLAQGPVAGPADARQRRRRDRPGDVVDAGGHDQRVLSRRQPVRARRPARPRLSHRARASIAARRRRTRRRDCGRARRSRRRAAGHDQPPRDDAVVHLPGRGFRRRARDPRGRRAQSDLSRRRRSRSGAPKRSPRSGRTRTTRASARSRRPRAALWRRIIPTAGRPRARVETVERFSRADLVVFHARRVSRRGAVARHRRRRRRGGRDRARRRGARRLDARRRPSRSSRRRRPPVRQSQR